MKTLMRITFVTAVRLQAILRISRVRDHVNLFVNVNQKSNICKFQSKFVSRKKLVSTSSKGIFD